ncbi:alkyl sulfatase dimerization domain-containing protein [Ferrimonas sp. YFM]|uniref:alkyl/aryl-sulfatase n=1 Tax=Ferrimonas sp. YFM TaxID=3028878 RepID=UPI002572D847|nr:alkyl sulfatase dimerization domain-containing protein [Ferrimonas sp. YFM]BDY05106.1 SDS hydrolase SdsA1 [Ferrimonas sp. YFM]
MNSKEWVFLSAAAWVLAGCGGDRPPTEQGEASEFTHAHNSRVAQSLPLTSQQAFEDAFRGHIASPDSLTVKDAEGRVIWSLPEYAFLTGDAPDTVNPSLWRQAQLNNMAGLFEVSPGIYQIRGFDLANMTLIRGEQGWILVDPLTSKETAEAALAFAFDYLESDPITTLVYTHSHVDHFGGAEAATEYADGELTVVAPAGFMKEATSENILAGTAMVRRAGYQYGRNLPVSPQGHVDLGLGKSVAFGTVGLIPPNLEVTQTGERHTLDGVEFEFQMVSGSEAPSEFTFYLPQQRAFCGAEMVSQTMHNLYTLRGAKVRDALGWSRYIDEAASRYPEAEIYFGSHHWPVWGQERVQEFLGSQRDLYKFIHDQTLRLANQGYTPGEIAEQLQLPQGLRQEFSARGYYGTLKQNIRAVYQFYFGWYDGNPAHLDPLPRASAARRYVELAGGAEVMRNKAIAAMDLGEYRWAAELLNHLVFFDPDDNSAREMLARTYEQMGYQAESGTWRDSYLSAALELREGVPEGLSMEKKMAGVLQQTDIRHFLDALATRVDYEAAGEDSYSLVLEILDAQEVYLLQIANGVLHYRPLTGDPDDSMPYLGLSRKLFIQLASRQVAMQDLVTGDNLRVDGSIMDMVAFFRLFEPPESEFNIIEP